MRKGLFYAFPALMWMVFILFLTLQPAEVSSDLSGGIVRLLYNYVEMLNIPITFDGFHIFVRKAAHFSEYLVLGGLLFVALIPYQLKDKVQFFIVVIVGVLFASIDETIQLFVPGRHGSIVDVLIDTMGVIFSVLCFIIISKFRREANV